MNTASVAKRILVVRSCGRTAAAVIRTPLPAAVSMRWNGSARPQSEAQQQEQQEQPNNVNTGDAAIRSIYRQFVHILKRQQQQQEQQLQELRHQFRQPLAAAGSQTQQDRLHMAASRLSFLRMTATVKVPPRQQHDQQQDGNNSVRSAAASAIQRWVYKDGQRFLAAAGTLRDDKGRVISNWHGGNLDPEAVTRHRKQLHRMGFANNDHAKGFF